jgi:Ser-tRNA(Ala) deacylase AlaX
MISLNRKTQKLYYESALLSACSAVVVRVGPTHIELDRTIAYPQGGGQEADQGVLVLPGNRELRFVDVRKLYGTRPPFHDAPDILVDGIIQHEISEPDVAHLTDVREGDTVEVRIDCRRRAALSYESYGVALALLGCGRDPAGRGGTHAGVPHSPGKRAFRFWR